MAADWVLNGNFPANVATGSEKNAVSKYASDCFIGAANINSQVLTILAQTAIQDQINGAGGLAGAYSIMQAQARANLKNIAGVKPSYAE